jgi:bifunctional UDP-N-acetylglucosamine pyrophosphorylase/glucosamine-1-phosphate N-acetyltransferase
VLSPDVRIAPDAVLGDDCRLHAGVELRHGCVLGRGVEVETGSVLTSTRLDDGARVLPYSVLDGAIVGRGAVVGPFARLRPGAVLAAGAHVGNFVELKNTTLGEGSKANHLSYLGDADIGRRVNVGAGTITCNYDGYAKYRTTIDDDVLIGSDTQLVAPVRVGARAVVGAGTTVTDDVPPGALALTRAGKTHVEGYRDRLEARYVKKDDRNKG